MYAGSTCTATSWGALYIADVIEFSLKGAEVSLPCGNWFDDGRAAILGVICFDAGNRICELNVLLLLLLFAWAWAVTADLRTDAETVVFFRPGSAVVVRVLWSTSDCSVCSLFWRLAKARMVDLASSRVCCMSICFRVTCKVWPSASHPLQPLVHNTWVMRKTSLVSVW